MKVGIFGLIFALLFVCKIAGIGGMATVSWWIVFLPVYAPIILWLFIAGAFLGIWHYLTR